MFYEFVCAPGTLFDYVRKICDYPEKVSCLLDIPDNQKSPKSVYSSNERCYDEDDLIGNFIDCQRYQRCIYGQFHYFNCHDGLFFDTIKRKCVVQSEAKCLKRKPTSA